MKLTPFLLFIILLVVLVVAMVFGASTSKLVEGHTSSLWEEVRSEKVGTMTGDMAKIHETKDGVVMYYDIATGSVVIPGANNTVRTIPREMTDDSEVAAGSHVSDVHHLPPWTFVDTSNNLSVMYYPVEEKSALIVVMDNGTDEIVSVFMHERGVSSKYADIPFVLSPGLKKTINENEFITQDGGRKVQIQGVKSKMITKDLFYSHAKGITILKNVAEKEYSSSKDFHKGLSLQYNENMLAVSVLMEHKIRTGVIVRKEDGYKIVASYSINKHDMKEREETSVVAKEEIEKEHEDGDKSDAMHKSDAITLPPISIVVETKTKEQEDDVSKAEETIVKPLDSMSSAPMASCDKDSNYILKSEIVPPVCPGCPPCSVVSSSTCNLSVNANGEIVDCNGKRIEGDSLLASNASDTSSSPGSWSKGLGDNVENIATTGITTAGNTVDKTLDTASGAFDKTLDTATGVLDTGVDAVGNVASGAADVVTGISSDVAGLGNNVIDTTADLLQGAGSALTRPVTLNQQQQMVAQQQPVMVTYPAYYGPIQQGQSNPTVPPGYGYSYPQQCAPQRGPGSSTFMPITNDFSQFS